MAYAVEDGMDELEDDDLFVGSQVLVNNKHKAVIRYIGATTFAEGVWYGLEMEREIGKHEGTVLGVTYFTTPKKRGTFVKRENLVPYDPEQEASTLMQSAVRMSLAKRKTKAEMSWRAFNVLDADEESRNLARRQRLMHSALGARLARERPSPAELDRWEAEAMATTVEAGYDGPVLTLPVTLDQVTALMAAFKAGKCLHYKYAVPLVAAYRRYADELPTMLDVTVEAGTTLTVCGDTHGQLQDLFSIFTLNGVPSPTNRYLMNGDFVDRGEHSCEIVLTLMAFALLYPGDWGTAKHAGCILNRGNHESHNQNMTGGFMTEVLDKYAVAGGDGSDAERGLRMYDMFQASFDAMPIAQLISSGENRIFVVHGGLMQHPGVTLAHVNAVNRKREIPYGYPGFEDKLFEDLMWSDPRLPEGTSPSDRGAGVFFGPDVTEAFCATNGLSLIIRSHECVPEGYAFMHNSKLLTVFSASRYCGRGTNRGAYVVLEPDLRVTVQQFVAAPLEATTPALQPPKELAPDHVTAYEACTPITHDLLIFLSGAHAKGHLVPAVDDESEAKQQDAVRRMIMERVVLRKPDLYIYWATLDRVTAQDGTITKMQWADGMRSVLGLDMPWLSLAPTLCDADPLTGRINYSKFLDRYRIAMRDTDVMWMEGIVERACQRLFAACHTLEAAYKYFDNDGSGVIEFDELEHGLLKMDLGLSRSQVVELMSTMDEDGDGRIQYDEFVNRFKLVFSQVKDDATPRPDTEDRAEEEEEGGGGGAADSGHGRHGPSWVASALQRIGTTLMTASRGDPASAFTAIDVNGDGLLSELEFRNALRVYGLEFSDEEVHALLRAIDANQSGEVNFREFCAAFRISDTTAAAGALRIFSSSPSAQAAGEAAVAAGGAGCDLPPAATPAAPAPSTTSLPATGADGGGGAITAPRPTELPSSTPATTVSTAAGGAGVGTVAPTLTKRSSRDHLLRRGSSKEDLAAAAAAELSRDSGRGWQHCVIEQVVSTLFEYRMELAAAFKLFDLDGNGVISRDEFRQGLQALTGLSGSPITDMQCDEMLKVLDTDGNGEISWTEFVGAFRLIDAKEPDKALAPNADLTTGAV